MPLVSKKISSSGEACGGVYDEREETQKVSTCYISLVYIQAMESGGQKDTMLLPLHRNVVFLHTNLS